MNTLSFLGKLDYVSIAVFCLLSFGFLKKVNLRNSRPVLFALGFCFSFFPAFIVALTGHRDDIISGGYGLSYTPIYFQYFGTYLLIFLLFYSVRERLKGIYLKDCASFIFCLLFSVIAVINLGQNRFVAHEENKFFLYPRKVLQAALEKGILDGIPGSSTILRNYRFPYDYYWFFSNFDSKLTYHVEEPNEVFMKTLVSQSNGKPSKSSSIDTSKLNIWALTYRYNVEGRKEGNVFLSKVSSIDYDGETLKVLRLNTDRVKLFQYRKKRVSRVCCNSG